MPKLEIRLQYNKAHFDYRKVGIGLQELEIKQKTIQGKKVEYVETEDLPVREDQYLVVDFRSNTAGKEFTCHLIAPDGYVLRFYYPSIKNKSHDVSWPTFKNAQRQLVTKRFYVEKK